MTLKPRVSSADAATVPRLPLAALSATLLTLTLSVTAQAAPTGTVAGRDIGKGDFALMAEVTWDGCPEVCDWRINVVEVPAASECSPDGRTIDGVAGPSVHGGVFRDRTPYAANGTQRDAAVYRLLKVGMPAMPTRRVLCLAAVGLTPPNPRPTASEEEKIQWELNSFQNCQDPTPYYPGHDRLSGRCLRFVPLGHVAFDVQGYNPVLTGPYNKNVTLTDGSARTARITLSRTEAVKALRRKKVKGKISCKKVSTAKQRCRVTAKKRKRTYTVTETAKGIRVKKV